MRVVKYTADKENGFQAQVFTSGHDDAAPAHIESHGGHHEHEVHHEEEIEGGGDEYY